MNCTDLFTHVNMNLTHNSFLARQQGYCVDPAEANVKGVSTFGPTKKLSLSFLPCRNDPEVQDKEAACKLVED